MRTWCRGEVVGSGRGSGKAEDAVIHEHVRGEEEEEEGLFRAEL